MAQIEVPSSRLGLLLLLLLSGPRCAAPAGELANATGLGRAGTGTARGWGPGVRGPRRGWCRRPSSLFLPGLLSGPAVWSSGQGAGPRGGLWRKSSARGCEGRTGQESGALECRRGPAPSAASGAGSRAPGSRPWSDGAPDARVPAALLTCLPPTHCSHPCAARWTRRPLGAGDRRAPPGAPPRTSQPLRSRLTASLPQLSSLPFSRRPLGPLGISTAFSASWHRSPFAWDTAQLKAPHLAQGT